MKEEQTKTCFVYGVEYKAKDESWSMCVGCAGRTNDLLCEKLAACSGIIWVKSEDTPPTEAAEVVDQQELRSLWKRAYVAAIGTDSTPYEAGKFAVEDYKRAVAEGVV